MEKFLVGKAGPLMVYTPEVCSYRTPEWHKHRKKGKISTLKAKLSPVSQNSNLKQCQKLIRKADPRHHSQSFLKKKIIWGLEHFYFFFLGRMCDMIQWRNMSISWKDPFATFLLESEAILLWCCNVSNHLIPRLLSCTHTEHQSKPNAIWKIII